MTTRTEKPTRTIYVRTHDGEKLIEGVPANAKVTYSDLNPGKPSYGHDSKALRIYTTQSNQLACFVGVTEFRDTSLTVKERERVGTSVSKSEVGPNGSSHVLSEDVDYEWTEVRF